MDCLAATAQASPHALAATAPHLVPIVACHFELGLLRHFDLSEREQIVETGFARHLLLHEPAHLFEGGSALEPGKERVALPRSTFTQALEPDDEGIHVSRNVTHERSNSLANGLYKIPFRCKHARFTLELVLPMR